MQMSDLSQAGAYAREAIVAASRAGMVRGYPDHTFRPKEHATRADTAVMLVHLLKLDPELRTILEP